MFISKQFTEECWIKWPQSQLECGLGVLHVPPLWVKGPVHDQIGVVGSSVDKTIGCVVMLG